jgi:hypothetical protein
VTAQHRFFSQFDTSALAGRGGSVREAFRSAKATAIVVLVFGVIFGAITLFALISGITQLITGVDRTDAATPTAARLTAVPGLIFSLVLFGTAVFFIVRFFRDAFRRQRMAEFARNNGLEFVGYRSGAHLRGVGFQAPGDGRWHSHVVRGVAQGHAFELGDFEVAEEERSGKGRKRTVTVTRFAYLAVGMPLRIPHTFFDATQNGKWRRFTGELVRWDLEGHFPTQFRTFTERGREREMLEVISPDIMQVFSDHGLDHDIELNGAQLVLVHPGTSVASRPGLDALLARGSAITAELDSRIPAWHRG